jgi:ubiquinone/menaquinone biosynthesis C-methylase UbiE
MAKKPNLVSLARRALLRAWRMVNPRSVAGLAWKRQGEHITFKSHGFVAAPNIPLLFARHHYENQAIRVILAGHKFTRSLEIGCGFGRLSPTFASLSHEHVAVDINPAAIAAARAAYPTLRFETVDGRRLPFPDGSFDFVTTWTVLQHIPPEQIAATVAEVRRVLAPAGTVLLCEETRNPGAPSQHCWHRAPEFYQEAFAPLRLAHSSYIDEIDRLPGLASPGRVMLLVS